MENIFVGESVRALLAGITYRLLKSGKWVRYEDVKNEYLPTSERHIPISKMSGYGDLKKAFLDIRAALSEN